MFQGAEGIVDLGASLSVIGEIQFQELCNHLPLKFQQSMKTAPCDISFRFGNDSTVSGKKAVYLPLGQWWMKLIVVPSNTPFLIANSMFRTLGAIINTNTQEIYFSEIELHRALEPLRSSFVHAGFGRTDPTDTTYEHKRSKRSFAAVRLSVCV